MIAIRKTEDLNELLAWRREVIEHVFGLVPDEALMRANEAYYKKQIADGMHLAYIASIDNEGVGCGAICLSEELPSPDNPSGKCAYLMNIYVRQGYRAHGIGHAIVRKLMDEAKKRGCGKIYLETTPDGRSLYESLGFKDLPDMMKLSR